MLSDIADLTNTLEESSKLIREVQQRLINVETKINFLLERELPLSGVLVQENADQRWGGRTFAQHGDDFIALALLDTLGITKPSYIDIGAHHPFNISNTALMYSLGGRGVNIEPNPILFETFLVQRPEDINLNCGVSDKAGQLKFHLFDDRSGLNTFSIERVRAIEDGSTFRVQRTLDIPVETVTAIINAHCGGKAPDFMSLDVEGLDAKILASIDYEHHRPAVICVEANTVQEENEIKTLLFRKDYGLRFKSVVNLFFSDDRRS